MSLVGYARVSSKDQNLDVQLDMLKNYGCNKIFSEKATGTDSQRPELKACLKYLREGDTLVITRLDRLARSQIHLGQIAEQLNKDKISFVVTEQKIDTTNPQGKLMFHMIGAFAEFETGLRKERQREGIKRAVDNGVRFGREQKFNEEIVKNIMADKKNGISYKEIMKKYDISKASYYRLTKAN